MSWQAMGAVQAGELALERYGSGRGTHTVYRILLPVERSEDGQRLVKRSDGEMAVGLVERVARLEAKLRELEDRGERSVGARSEGRAQEGHTKVEKGHR